MEPVRSEKKQQSAVNGVSQVFAGGSPQPLTLASENETYNGGNHFQPRLDMEPLRARFRAKERTNPVSLGYPAYHARFSM